MKRRYVFVNDGSFRGRSCADRGQQVRPPNGAKLILDESDVLTI